MYEIEMTEASQEFARCWKAAGQHLQRQAQGGLLKWHRAHLTPPFLEHLSFLMGNQLFFIRIEDIGGNIQAPGNRRGLLKIAAGCSGYPCIMPMSLETGIWVPQVRGWGLTDARTGRVLNPPDLLTHEQIEMTDWELHDFGVQIVRNHLEQLGKELMSWHGNPAIDPSIWFVGDSGPEWVVVRTVRFPKQHADPPSHWQQIAEGCARLGVVGHFGSVSVGIDGSDQVETAAPEPLWRGHRLLAWFNGLVSESAGSPAHD